MALCPGAAFGPAKLWPHEYFAELAKTMLDKGWQVWLLGAKGDKHIAAAIQNACGNACVDFTGETDLGDAVDLLAACDLVVGNDSGLNHIAAAQDKAVITLYGPTPSEYTPPLCDNGHIVRLDLECSPCRQRECPLGHHDCLKQLKPQQITQIITRLFP